MVRYSIVFWASVARAARIISSLDAHPYCRMSKFLAVIAERFSCTNMVSRLVKMMSKELEELFLWKKQSWKNLERMMRLVFLSLGKISYLV